MLKKVVDSIIHSNIYISLAAVLLTIATQIQLGLQPQLHPYLFLIFFATLFEYNIHKFITAITNKEALQAKKHSWVRNNLKLFYWIVFLSAVGFLISIFWAKREVLISLAPLAALTLFYSLPIYGNKNNLFRLREIPYLKIFIISFVWSVSTILLPIIQFENLFEVQHLYLMLIERFIFIFAITIPFDIRDIEADNSAGLRTIANIISVRTSLNISWVLLVIFWVLHLFHYSWHENAAFLIAISISTFSTIYFILNKKVQSLPNYHYGILDGTMLLQGVLIWLFYIIDK